MAISLAKTITKASAVSGVWTYTLSDVDGLIAGEPVQISGFTTANYNIERDTLDAVDTVNKTVQITHGNTTVAKFETTAELNVYVTWVDAEYVSQFLGYTPAGTDDTWLDTCCDAAGGWAFKRRLAAGYTDYPYATPSPSVKLGCGLYAAALFRERGSIDSFQTFDAQSMGAPMVGTMSQINRLLGINRSAIG